MDHMAGTHVGATHSLAVMSDHTTLTSPGIVKEDRDSREVRVGAIRAAVEVD